MSDNFDIKVASFVPTPTVPSEPERDLWPSQGMPCEVEGCTSPHFHKFDYYIRHWKKFHERFVDVYGCSMTGCGAKFPNRNSLRHHYMKVHLLNEQDMKVVNLNPHQEHNMYYTNPKGLLPRKYVKPSNIEARERARRERREYAEKHRVEFPNLPTNREVNRGNIWILISIIIQVKLLHAGNS